MILINKVVKGCKGVLVVMVCGVVIDVVSGILCRFLYWKWLFVKIVIIDLFLVMMLMVRKVFFVVKLINDCFYVQQFMFEVVDWLRICYWWKVFDVENQVIREYC